jgi:hypothetical protein
MGQFFRQSRVPAERGRSVLNDREAGRTARVRPTTSGLWRTLVQLAQFALAIASYLEELLDVLDGLFLRVSLHHGEAADYLFGFGERPVSDREIAVRKANTRAARAGHAALDRQEETGLHAVFDELPHCSHFFVARETAGFFCLVDA